MKRCPRCERTFPDSETFCNVDGTALVSGAAATTRTDEPPATAGDDSAAGSGKHIECPVCGGQAEPGEVICNFCGARLDQGAASGPPPRSGLQTPAPGTRQRTTERVEPNFSDDRPAAETGVSRRILGSIGYIVAALIALIGGAWLALHLSSRQAAKAPVAQVSPTAAPSPAIATGPMVTLASNLPLQTTGAAAAAPERDREALTKVLDDNKAALLDHYRHALEADSGAHDGLILHLLISPDGKVTAASVKTSTAPNPGLDAELVNSVMTWNFPPTGAGTAEVEMPLIFAHDPPEVAATESALSAKLASLSPSEPPEYALAPEASPTAVPTPAEAAVPPPPVPAARRAPARPPRRAAAPKPSLLQQVQEALRADRRLGRVKLYTNSGGVITLYGQVFDDKTKRLAATTVRDVSGVNDVINNLTTDTGQWLQEQSDIMRQLQGAGLDKVTVRVIGKEAYLDGEVKTELDKQRAVTITEGAAPVKVRVNLIRVALGSVF